MASMEELQFIAIGNPEADIGPVAESSPIIEAAGMILPSLYELAGSRHNIIRVAGLSGFFASAICLWGNHRLRAIHDKGEAAEIFESANEVHFFHSLGILATAMGTHPIVSGGLMALGTLMYCGMEYYRAFTGDHRFARLTKIGLACLIAGWISLAL